jgi:hypothetical protein
MAEEIKAALVEIKNLHKEIDHHARKLKELRARKKELDTKVLEYIKENEAPGLKLGNIIFMEAERKTTTRKKKDEVARDVKQVLTEFGVTENLEELMKQLELAKKGPSKSVSILKPKAAGILDD